MTISFKGVNKVSKQLKRLEKKFPREVTQGLLLEADEAAGDSKANYVPVNRSNLMNSIGARVVKELLVEVYAGGQSAPYALAIHEHLSVHSPPSWRGTTVEFRPPGRGPKFLLTPLMNRADKISSNVTDYVNTRIKGLI